MCDENACERCWRFAVECCGSAALCESRLERADASAPAVRSVRDDARDDEGPLVGIVVVEQDKSKTGKTY